MTEDEMVGWHHRLNEHEFEQTPGDSEGTGKPGVLQSMGSQRVKHNWATEQQPTFGNPNKCLCDDNEVQLHWLLLDHHVESLLEKVHTIVSRLWSGCCRQANSLHHHKLWAECQVFTGFPMCPNAHLRFNFVRKSIKREQTSKEK